MPDRLPPPGPSQIREQTVRLGDRALRVGMGRPADGPEGWWLTVLWLADDEGVVSFEDLLAGDDPPPIPPLARLGPSLAGALGGLLLEEGGRYAIRLTPVAPPDDPDQPWRCPVAIRAAFKWEPARAASLRANELGELVLTGFRQSIEAVRRR